VIPEEVNFYGKSFELMMTHPEALPPPLWYPPNAIVPYYRYVIAGKFPVQVIPGHRNVPLPPRGSGLTQDGGSSLEKRIFPKKKMFNGRV
jgi:hypothetical protein